MAREYLTHDFLITQVKDGGDLEVWVDWVPAVDGTPGLKVSARRDGGDLLIEPKGADDPDRLVRRLPNVASDVLEDLQAGKPLIWKLCGPSGVLASYNLILEP